MRHHDRAARRHGDEIPRPCSREYDRENQHLKRGGDESFVKELEYKVGLKTS
jgi:hypothetical protein